MKNYFSLLLVILLLSGNIEAMTPTQGSLNIFLQISPTDQPTLTERTQRKAKNLYTNTFDKEKYTNNIEKFFAYLSNQELISMAVQIDYCTQKKMNLLLVNSFEPVDVELLKNDSLYRESEWRISSFGIESKKQSMKTLVSHMGMHPKKTTIIFLETLKNELIKRQTEIKETLFALNEETFGFQIKFNPNYQKEGLQESLLVSEFKKTMYYDLLSMK